MFSEYNLVRKNEMKLEERFSYLKNQFFENDDRACFIERERILARLDKKMATYYEYDREAKIFAEVLDGLSTPIDDQDFILGRMVEALPDPGMGPSKRIRYFYGEEMPQGLSKGYKRNIPQPSFVFFWTYVLQLGDAPH